MSIVDQALKSNNLYAQKYDPKLGRHPQPRLAVITCMDSWLSDLEGILGLKNADIDVIWTGGAAVTEDDRLVERLQVITLYFVNARVPISISASRTLNSPCAVQKSVGEAFFEEVVRELELLDGARSMGRRGGNYMTHLDRGKYESNPIAWTWGVGGALL